MKSKTKKKSGHSPLPWHAGSDMLSRFIYEESGWAIANTTTSNGKNREDRADANAEFIVRAANSHYKLLGTLKLLSNSFQIVFPSLPKSMRPGIQAAIDEMEAAITKAEGRE